MEEPLNDKLYLLNSHIQYNVNKIKDCLLGRLLTLIEASIEDRERRKAIKSIARNEIWKDEPFSQEIKEIIIQFAEKYTKVSAVELRKWSGLRDSIPINRDWFK